MVLVQKWPFFQLFFLGNIEQENVFYDILEQKNAFLGYKNKKFKQSKNCHFSNFFLFGSIGQENVFYDILKRKSSFQAIKTRSSKSRKIDIFPKGLTHGFGPKMAIFPTFSFYIIQARKISFTRFYNEKMPFQAIKTKRSKSRKISSVPTVLVQKRPIFQLFFFLAIQGRKMSFTIFWNGKTPFQAIKTRSSKRLRIDIFPKGLTYGFG